MKRFFVALTTSVLLSMMLVASPVAASSETFELNRASRMIDRHVFHGSLRSMVAEVVSVDVDAKTVLILRAGRNYTVDASDALVVKITNEDGAKTVALADLSMDEKAYFLVRKQLNSKGHFRAVLIVQSLKPALNPSEEKPSVYFGTAASSGSEATTSVDIPVYLSKTYSHDVKVHYSITGMATGDGVDFTRSNGELVIPSGQTSAYVRVMVKDDTSDELNETVVMSLFGAKNASIGGYPVHTYTILDND